MSQKENQEEFFSPLSPKTKKKFTSPKFLELKKKASQLSLTTAMKGQQAITEKLRKENKTKKLTTLVNDKHNIIEDIENQLPKLYRTVRKESEIFGDLADSVKTLSENYVAYAGSRADTEQLTEFMFGLGGFQSELNLLMSKLGTNLLEQVSNPLSEFTKGEIFNAKSTKLKWNQLRLNYDALFDKLEGLKEKGAKESRIKEVEAECFAAKAQFDKIDRDTSEYLDQTRVFTELELIKHSVDYFRCYQSFFQSGLELISKFLPKIQAIEEYETSKKRESSSFSRVNPTLRQNNSSSSIDLNDLEYPVNQPLVAYMEDEENTHDHLLNDLPSSSSSSVPVMHTEVLDEEYNAKIGVIMNEIDEIESTHQETDDVGQMLKQMMETENKKLEMEYIKKEYQAKKKPKEKKKEEKKAINFDPSNELKHGSRFYNTFLQLTKSEWIPGLLQRLDQVRIPENEEMIDSKLGQISFGIGELAVKNLIIPDNGIDITFTQNEIRLILTNITASLEKFSWFYKKESFPKLKDKGDAVSGISKAIILVRIQFNPTGESGPELSVDTIAIKVGSLDLKISGTAASVLYNTIFSAFSNSMKRKVQSELQKVLYEFFQDAIENFFDRW